MPPLCWLLFAVLIAAPASANTDTNIGWFWGLPISFLLLLVAGLSLYSLKLQRRNQTLTEDQQMLQSFLHQSDDMVAILSDDLTPTYVNPALSVYSEQTEQKSPLSLALYLDPHGTQLLLPMLDLQSNWYGEAWLQTTISEQKLALSVAITKLGRAPHNYLLIGRDINSLKQLQQQTEQDYIRDSQTGFVNRAVLTEYLQTFICFSNTKNPKFGLLLVKFNQLLSADTVKPLTDKLNNFTALSASLHNVIDNDFILARYDNDTLAVVVPPHLCNDQPEAELNRLAHKILSLPERLSTTNRTVPIQTLVGISIYPLDGQEPADLIFSASCALQSAGKIGHNNLLFANAGIQQHAPEYLMLESELRKAVQFDELDIYYQPRISIGSNRVIGYEALLRWHSPKRGILMPEHFMSIASQTGLLVQLDRLVFKKCCEQLQYWLQTGINRGRIALNIANLSFRQTDFVSNLEEQLKTSGLSADQFELELDEEILLQPDKHTSETLQQLATLGFHLTLDNFGAGISSLSVLRKYPLNSLKITQSFVKDMEHNEQQRNITASVIRLASYLHLNVIANGIENEMQAYLLHVMGCDVLQGHLFSKALPAAEIPAFLAKENKLFRKEVG
jgi:EAL domain-containing protein (putative c-di-GMP-specific phosphodiesterase class I)/GGDEF domain-containing protein